MAIQDMLSESWQCYLEFLLKRNTAAKIDTSDGTGATSSMIYTGEMKRGACSTTYCSTTFILVFKKWNVSEHVNTQKQQASHFGQQVQSLLVGWLNVSLMQLCLFKKLY